MGANKASEKRAKERAEMQAKALVDTPGLDQLEMADRWKLIDALLGGTDRMREEADTWLPKMEKEQDRHWRDRRDRSFLFPALKDTLDKVAAKPFEKPVQVKNDELPTLLQPIADNADLQGNDLTAFAKMLFKDAETRGLTHVLVDSVENTKRLADTRIRPNFVHIKAEDLIAARFERGQAGELIPTHLRYREVRTESHPDNEFGEIQVHRIKEWERQQFRVWTQNAEGEFVADGWRPHSYLAKMGGGIPLHTIYFDQDGTMRACPPFSKLAEMNLEHFQKKSDHSNLARFASVGVLALSGYSEKDEDGNDRSFTWGPRNTLISENSDSKAYIVEHTGSALDILGRDLTQLQEQMEVLGLEPFMRKTGAETATGKALHVGKSDSAIKAWIDAIEEGLVAAYRMAARWMSTASRGASDLEIPEDWKPRLFSDFKVPVLKGVDDTQHLLAMRTSREISYPTFIEETKRRGILSEDVDAEEEQERLEEEVPQMPPPSNVTPPDEGGGDDDAGTPDSTEEVVDEAA